MKNPRRANGRVAGQSGPARRLWSARLRTETRRNRAARRDAAGRKRYDVNGYQPRPTPPPTEVIMANDGYQKDERDEAAADGPTGETTANEGNEDNHPSIQFVMLCESMGEIATRLIKAALDDAGIPTVLTGDALDTVHIYPAHDSRILVPATRLENAQRILDVVTAPTDDAELARQSDESEYRCDACGAVVPEDAAVCPECGESFE
jgi:hypothetical protein